MSFKLVTTAESHLKVKVSDYLVLQTGWEQLVFLTDCLILGKENRQTEATQFTVLGLGSANLLLEALENSWELLLLNPWWKIRNAVSDLRERISSSKRANYLGGKRNLPLSFIWTASCCNQCGSFHINQGYQDVFRCGSLLRWFWCMKNWHWNQLKWTTREWERMIHFQ